MAGQRQRENQQVLSEMKSAQTGSPRRATILSNSAIATVTHRQQPESIFPIEVMVKKVIKKMKAMAKKYVVVILIPVVLQGLGQVLIMATMVGKT